MGQGERELRPVQTFEALPEERAAVLAYARSHPEIRHRELAWRMIEDDAAQISPSTAGRSHVRCLCAETTWLR
jgi:hypothetical protein